MNAAELEDALARRHESASIRDRLAEEAATFIRTKRYADALRVFDAIVEFTDLAPAHYCNATWLVQKDNTGLAIDAARSRRYLAACLPHAPRNPAIHLNAAAVFTEQVRRFELEPLARRCHETPRAQWKVHVTEWLRFAAGPPGEPAPALPPRVPVSPDSLEPAPRHQR
jgi:hypothetical protein